MLPSDHWENFTRSKIKLYTRLRLHTDPDPSSADRNRDAKKKGDMIANPSPPGQKTKKDPDQKGKTISPTLKTSKRE